MIVLKFVAGEAPYTTGDVASFENDADAQKFIDMKVAKDITSKVKLPKKVETPEVENKDVKNPPKDKMIDSAETK